MTLDDTDREILAILEQDDATPSATLAEKLGITEGEVEERIGRLADTRTKILVVDDEPDTLLPLTRALEADNYAVVSAVDGAEALIKVSNETPDLILLDLMMPGLGGVEVLEQIRRVDSDVAVVIFTGYPSLDTAVQSMKLDAVDYLKKPFNPDEFREVLDRVMRKKGLLRTPEENLHRVIGETIRGLRKDRGLTLKQMARRTGLSVSLLSQIERAESSASISSGRSSLTTVHKILRSTAK